MTRTSIEGLPLIAGNLALDFVNTVGNRLGEPREYLTNTSELKRWARLAGVSQPIFVTSRDLPQLRTIRDELHQLFNWLASGRTPSARQLEALNARLRGIAPKRKLISRKGMICWRWDASESLLGLILSSAVELLVSGLYLRIRQCEGRTCGWLFVDRSPGGHRRWCSMSDCGNRAKVNAHYRRTHGE